MTTDAAGQGAPLSAVAVQEALARVSLRAETLAALGGDAAHSAGALLAQAARTLHAMLDLVAEERHDQLLRVARLERWLTLRAQSEPAAGCAADPALWVLEHLEGWRTRRAGDAAPTRRRGIVTRASCMRDLGRRR